MERNFTETSDHWCWVLLQNDNFLRDKTTGKIVKFATFKEIANFITENISEDSFNNNEDTRVQRLILYEN